MERATAKARLDALHGDLMRALRRDALLAVSDVVLAAAAEAAAELQEIAGEPAPPRPRPEGLPRRAASASAPAPTPPRPDGGARPTRPRPPAPGPTPVGARAAGCESMASTPCLGAVAERRCPEDGCTWSVKLCDAHGTKQSFGGVIAGHKHARHKKTAAADEEDPAMGLTLVHSVAAPKSTSTAPPRPRQPNHEVKFVKCAVDGADGLPCGALVSAADDDLLAHLHVHGVVSRTPELYFVAPLTQLSTVARARPRTYRAPTVRGRALPIVTALTGPLPGRPQTRGECVDGPRPCPWVSCRYHLFLEVKANGGILENFPGREPWELAQTCALDIAEKDGITLEEVGTFINLTRERARQLELSSLVKLRRLAVEFDRVYVGEGLLANFTRALRWIAVAAARLARRCPDCGTHDPNGRRGCNCPVSFLEAMALRSAAEVR